MELDKEELEATRNRKCEYCKEDMEGKQIEGEGIIETLVDECFLYVWCECGYRRIFEINYCPICGRKLV